jgi:Outer membrane protein beta-barrel domain
MQQKIILQFFQLKSTAVFSCALPALLSMASCCFIPMNDTSRKTCNCGPEKNIALSAPQPQKETTPAAGLVAGKPAESLSASNTSFPLDSFSPGADVEYSLQDDETIFKQISQYSSHPSLTTMSSISGSLNIQQNLQRTKAEKKLPLGIKKINSHLVAGPNISFKSSKEDYGNVQHKHKPGIGFQAGIRSDYFFSEKFAVTAGLLFKQNNASEELNYNSPGEPGGGNYNENFTTKYQYNYLSVPILAMYQATENLSVSAGPELNYLVGASSKTDDGDKESLTKNSTKFGVGVQAAVKYKFAGVPIAVELLYDHRISRLNEKTTAYSPGSSYDSPAWNMKGIQLNIVCALCELLKKR